MNTKIAAFDAFNTDKTQLTEPMNIIKTFFQLLYLAEFQIAVFAAVIAVILLGLSFVLFNDSMEISINKKWAVRIVLALIVIFSGGYIIGMVWDAHI